MTHNIKAIVFDYGGVLLDWDPRNLYRRYFPNNPEALEHFLAETNFMEWNAQQDKGRSLKEGIALLANQHPQHAHLIYAFHDHWEETILGPIPETVEILKRLKQKGYPLYGLSNWSAETFQITRKKFDFFDIFDDMVISGEVNMIKPEPEIFNLLLKKIGLPASECLLIDDSDKNISAAQKIGFQTIHFKSASQLRSELARKSILD
jgi:2-haloacid dehalogenase